MGEAPTGGLGRMGPTPAHYTEKKQYPIRERNSPPRAGLSVIDRMMAFCLAGDGSRGRRVTWTEA